LRAASLGINLLESPAMTESPLVKRLMYSGLLAGIGALASVATTRLAAVIWMRVFGEEPPE
jgi:hypothetical protein